MSVTTANGSGGARKYALPVRAIHWLMALLIIGMILSGLVMNNLVDDRDLRRTIVGLHIAFGVLVLLFAILRLALRARFRAPPLPEAIPLRERRLARGGHVMLYLLMFLVPILGYVMVAAAAVDGVNFFGLALPSFGTENRDLHEQLEGLHIWGAYILGTLVLLHVAAALKHRVVERDPQADILKRML